MCPRWALLLRVLNSVIWELQSAAMVAERAAGISSCLKRLWSGRVGCGRWGPPMWGSLHYRVPLMGKVVDCCLITFNTMQGHPQSHPFSHDTVPLAVVLLVGHSASLPAEHPGITLASPWCLPGALVPPNSRYSYVVDRFLSCLLPSRATWDKWPAPLGRRRVVWSGWKHVPLVLLSCLSVTSKTPWDKALWRLVTTDRLGTSLKCHLDKEGLPWLLSWSNDGLRLSCFNQTD
jgi:hypothetical protein